ncbi:PREDICTED: uncharacterized protein LOC106805331 [Priapulus caudatus]|uniref:Uncharacterized protein LOC106805331 n=1 Tax=Priapulus caudatus TaxID=37621 RepID=A0ABM1DQZ7_PRICU|nr:PREDICTED: uncharacterized protein LOC106805331 [Priapulus caudatus]
MTTSATTTMTTMTMTKCRKSRRTSAAFSGVCCAFVLVLVFVPAVAADRTTTTTMTKTTSTTDDVCDSVCTCRSRTVTCIRPNSLTSIPQLPSDEWMANISEIYIENQDNLTELNAESLSRYTYLEKL